VAGCGHLGRKPEVGDNLPDDDGVFDGGHGRQTNYAAARGGGQTCGARALTCHREAKFASLLVEQPVDHGPGAVVGEEEDIAPR
jgi:hypothetical protein